MALVATQIAPSQAQAKRANKASGQFSTCSSTRSPGRIPRAERPPARQATSCTKEAEVQVFSGPSPEAQLRTGRSGRSAALRVRSEKIRSEERRGRKEWVRTCRSRWAPYH